MIWAFDPLSLPFSCPLNEMQGGCSCKELSFSEVTRKQHLSQLAVHACVIPRYQECSWRTNRQPVSSLSNSKAVKTLGAATPLHQAVYISPSVPSIWLLRRLTLALAAETIYLLGFKSYRWCWNFAV